MIGITTGCLDKLSSTWQGIDKHQRLDSLRALTRSADGYAAYRSALDSVGTSACIPVIGKFCGLWTVADSKPYFVGIYVLILKSLDAKPDTIQVESSYNETTELINFAKRREMADVCRQALRFQGRIPSPEHVQENLDIQAWIEEQFEVAGSRPDTWFAEKAAEVQRREEDHVNIRYKLLAPPLISTLAGGTDIFLSAGRVSKPRVSDSHHRGNDICYFLVLSFLHDAFPNIRWSPRWMENQHTNSCIHDVCLICIWTSSIPLALGFYPFGNLE